MKMTSKTTGEIMNEHFGKKAKLLQQRAGNVCYSYDRVSSRDQMINGNSLAWQYERMDEYAGRNGLIIKTKYGGTFESAKTDERKEFKRMLADIKKDPEVSAIMVYSYDRFSRSGANGIYLLENLRKLGVRIIAITQEVDSFTPTGNFQENLYLLISKLDNDMRRDKSVAGSRSILRKGYWPYSTPLGYTNQNKRTTADKHVYIINEKGLLLKQAFKWKASGKYSNQEIVDKLSLKGLKIKLCSLAWVFANPFYCGYISSSLLPGELIKGKHPALIDESTFLKSNNIKQLNPRTGVLKKNQQDELPLKVFAKDFNSLSPFTGYLNKTKNIYYYKTRDLGTKVNVSANKLNSKFQELLSHLEYNSQYKNQLKTLLKQKLEKHFQESKTDVRQNKKRITELTSQINTLEERFVLGDISKELYDKYVNKYKSDLEKLSVQNDQTEKMSSNLEKAVEKTLKYAENISQIWVSANYTNKQLLQYLVFPDGIFYDKENSTVRTTRINELFRQIPLQERVLAENKKDNQNSDCLFFSHVGTTRFELATPSTPC